MRRASLNVSLYLYPGRACLLWLAAMSAVPAPAAGAEPGPGLGPVLGPVLSPVLSPAPAAQARKPAAPEGTCIDTEVNGYRALSYDCLNQKMAPVPTPRPPATLESEAVTQGPPNQMGLTTPATTGNRMGNTFGTSAFPQRPQP